MNLPRERALMLALLAVLPSGLYALLVRPSLKHLEALQARIRRADEACPLHPFTPVGPDERAVLEPPEAPWRARIPRLDGDRARPAHVDWVVGQANAAFQAGGARIAAMRAALGPVSADCTVPAGLRPGPAPRPSGPDQPECRVAGWVLEVQVGGGVQELFQALAAGSRARPLLEPVGLRWEWSASAGGDQPGLRPAGLRQYLVFRNCYLDGSTDVVH